MPAIFRILLLVIFSWSTSVADEWPQWRGPRRDSVYRETGIVESIPAGGLPIKWTADVAYGYSGPAVADGRVYLFDYLVQSGEIANLPSRRDQLTGQERLTAYDAATGELLWRESYPRDYAVSYGGGPRCTPTVDEQRVYTLGAEGDLVCRQTVDGKLLWQVNFKEKYGVETPLWGHAAHPLVIDNLLVCVAGGEGSVAVAFDKVTGEQVWKNLSAREPGYCPPTRIEHNGSQQLLIWHPESLNALVPETGKAIWSLPARPAYGMAIHAPAKLGDKLFISAIGDVSVMMQLKPDGSDVQVLWAGGGKVGLRGVNTTPMMQNEVIYGVDCETSELMAVSMADGQRLWTEKSPVTKVRRGRHGTAFLVRHEPGGQSSNRYFLFNENGELITARLTPKAYTETGRMPVVTPTSSSSGRPVVWSHPAFAGRAMYARNDQQLVCVDLAETAPASKPVAE